ncbi:MAG: CBS domain-containing protein [Acidimicrobiia bacterium]
MRDRTGGNLMQVVDLMTTNVISATPDTPIKDAARLMFRHRVSGLPVVGDAGQVLGIITEADFLKLEVARAGDEEMSTVETVGQVMNTGVVTVHAGMAVAEAAQIMVVQDVKRLPVIADDGKLVGIISRLDVVAVFTRPDEVIEDEIREDLLRRVMFVDPDEIDVRVANGIVTFVGEIGTSNESRLLEELARRLDGVMRVDNQLTWRVDDNKG